MSDFLYFIDNKTGKHGYKDNSGKVVVSPIYDNYTFENTDYPCAMSFFSKGKIVAVKRNNMYGCVNEYGDERLFHVFMMQWTQLTYLDI